MIGNHLVYPELAAIVGANVPNYQGMFLRGHGSQDHVQNNGVIPGNSSTSYASANLGVIQGDASRRLQGVAYVLTPDNGVSYSRSWWDSIGKPNSVRGILMSQYSRDVIVVGTYMSTSGTVGNPGGTGSLFYSVGSQNSGKNNSEYALRLDSANTTPTAVENRPANMAVKYIICAEWRALAFQSTYPELAAIVGPNVPNYQGMFLRGHGSQNHVKNNGTNVGYTATAHASGNLGEIQGDASRRIRGRISSRTPWWGNPVAWAGGECFGEQYESRTSGISGMKEADKDYPVKSNDMDSGLSTPAANENRPANVAVKWLVFAGD